MAAGSLPVVAGPSPVVFRRFGAETTQGVWIDRDREMPIGQSLDEIRFTSFVRRLRGAQQAFRAVPGTSGERFQGARRADAREMSAATMGESPSLDRCAAQDL